MTAWLKKWKVTKIEAVKITRILLRHLAKYMMSLCAQIRGLHAKPTSYTHKNTSTNSEATSEHLFLMCV